MPQLQLAVPLIFQNELMGEAIATGNNAAWLCPCGWALPLIGRSGATAGPTAGTEVNCPSPVCGRRYFVEPNGYDQAAVLRVVEI
jgi:hypothetical protein